MQNLATIYNLPDHQERLAQRTSVQDLLIAKNARLVDQTDFDYLKHNHPTIHLLGMVGFDVKQQKFVLLKPDQGQDKAQSESDLSNREQEILQLVAMGASNAQIARNLIISVNTVKVHLRNIFDKLQVQSRTEAAMYAVRQGWVAVA